MKINKLFVGLLCMTAAFLVACSDDDYTPAEKLANAQVYFPDSNPANISLDMTESVQTVNIPISRVKTDEVLTVALTVTGSDELVKVPTSVTFPEGKATVDIPVAVNSPELGYNNPRDISLAIRDSALTTIYGFSKYDFTIVVAQSWTSLGDALYTEDFLTTFFGVDNVEYEVEIQECDQVPGFYRLVYPYDGKYINNDPGDWDESKDYYFEIHAEDPDKVYIPVQKVGMAWSYGDFIMGSLAGYYLNKGDEASASQYYGTLKNGVITFPKNSLLIAMSGYNDGTLYSANSNGAFRIVFPGVVLGDYSLEIGYAGIFTDTDAAPHAVINAVLGPDVTAAKAVVVNKSDDSEAVADAIVAGDIEAVDITTGHNYLPLGDMTGELKVVAVTFDASDALAEISSALFEFYGAGNADPWQSLGIGLYTDDIVSSMYDLDPVSYEVEVQENSEIPGKYRIVAPYDSKYPYASEATSVAEGTYLVIDATDPEGVIIEPQDLGIDMGDGPFSFCSWGYYMHAEGGYDYGTLKEHGYLGTLSEGVIELPALSKKDDDGNISFYYQGLASFSDGDSYACFNGEFKLVLPDAYAAMDKAKVAKKIARNSSVKKSGKTAFKSLPVDKKMVKKQVIAL